MEVERLKPKNVIDTAGTLQYAQAVRAGNLLFVSGQPGWGVDMSVPSDYEEECRAAFRNIEAVLTEAGCGFADVVDVTSFHTPDTDTATFWRVRNEFFADPWPAWTLIRDIELALPTLHVEIKVTAVIPS